MTPKLSLLLLVSLCCAASAAASPNITWVEVLDAPQLTSHSMVFDEAGSRAVLVGGSTPPDSVGTRGLVYTLAWNGTRKGARWKEQTTTSADPRDVPTEGDAFGMACVTVQTGGARVLCAGGTSSASGGSRSTLVSLSLDGSWKWSSRFYGVPGVFQAACVYGDPGTDSESVFVIGGLTEMPGVADPKLSQTAASVNLTAGVNGDGYISQLPPVNGGSILPRVGHVLVRVNATTAVLWGGGASAYDGFSRVSEFVVITLPYGEAVSLHNVFYERVQANNAQGAPEPGLFFASGVALDRARGGVPCRSLDGCSLLLWGGYRTLVSSGAGSTTEEPVPGLWELDLGTPAGYRLVAATPPGPPARWAAAAALAPDGSLIVEGGAVLVLDSEPYLCDDSQECFEGNGVASDRAGWAADVTLPVDPAKTSLECAPASVEAGGRLACTVTTRSYAGGLAGGPLNGARLSVRYQRPGGAAPAAATLAWNDTARLFEASIEAGAASGAVRVNATYDGEPVRGSPAAAEVVAGPVDPRRCSASCPSRVRVGANATCVLLLRDEHGNAAGGAADASGATAQLLQECLKSTVGASYGGTPGRFVVSVYGSAVGTLRVRPAYGGVPLGDGSPVLVEVYADGGCPAGQQNSNATGGCVCSAGFQPVYDSRGTKTAQQCPLGESKRYAGDDPCYCSENFANVSRVTGGGPIRCADPARVRGALGDGLAPAPGGECSQCPAACATCGGAAGGLGPRPNRSTTGLAAPRAGFWRPDDAWGVVYACPRGESCVGGAAAACAAGYGGPLCAVCAAGHAGFGRAAGGIAGTECAPCASSAAEVAALVAFAAAAVALVAFTVATVERPASRRAQVLRVAVSFLQTQALAGQFRTRASRGLRALLDAFGRASSGGTALAFGCTRGGADLVDRLETEAAFAAVALLPAAALLAWEHVWRRRSCRTSVVAAASGGGGGGGEPAGYASLDDRQQHANTASAGGKLRRLYLRTALVLALLMWPYLWQSAAGVLGPCASVGPGGRVLAADLRVDCGSARYRSAAGLAWTVLAVLAAGLVAVWRGLAPGGSLAGTTAGRYLSGAFRTGSRAWSVVLQLRFAAIVACSSFLALAPVEQVLLGTLLLNCAAVLQSRVRPFAARDVNTAELLALVTANVTVVASGLLLPASDVSDTALWAITAFLVALNAGTAAFLLLRFASTFEAVARCLPERLRPGTVVTEDEEKG